MNELTTERLEKRIKNCIEVENGYVMLPVSVAEELLAYRKASQSVTAITTDEEMLHVMHGSNGQIFAECRADDFERKGFRVIKLYAAPVILEGWKLVPIEPTENMIIEGFESEPDKAFSKPEVWEEYAAMSGCKQAAHRAKLCWAAMLAAAPTSPEPK